MMGSHRHISTPPRERPRLSFFPPLKKGGPRGDFCLAGTRIPLQLPLFQRGRARFRRVLTSTAIALALPAFAQTDDVAPPAPDLSGTWTMTIQGKAPPGKNFASLAFERDGEATAVVMRGKAGELRGACRLDGDEIRFEHAPPGKKASVAVFTGRVRGDLMGGEVDMGKRGTSAWQAIREGDDVFDLSGTWTFFQKGLPRDYANLTKLHFHQDGADLVATFTTGEEETVCRGFLDGDTVGFEYSRETEGGAVGASYTGKVGGDMMRGEVDMGALGESTWQATRDDG